MRPLLLGYPLIYTGDDQGLALYKIADNVVYNVTDILDVKVWEVNH